MEAASRFRNTELAFMRLAWAAGNFS
jgi:hypothetical protein